MAAGGTEISSLWHHKLLHCLVFLEGLEMPGNLNFCQLPLAYLGSLMVCVQRSFSGKSKIIVKIQHPEGEKGWWGFGSPKNAWLFALQLLLCQNQLYELKNMFWQIWKWQLWQLLNSYQKQPLKCQQCLREKQLKSHRHFSECTCWRLDGVKSIRASKQSISGLV